MVEPEVVAVVEHLSIRDETNCKTAATALAAGAAVGTYIRGVCGIWVDGRSERAVETGYRIKGEKRGRRPFGVILSAVAASDVIDADRIASDVRRLFFDPALLAARLGSMCFLRYPIRQAVASSLPESVYSRDEAGLPLLQSWIPEGCATTDAWINQLRRCDVDLPIATSMNVSGNPELIDQDEGLEFCARHGIRYFLGDLANPGVARGSFPILEVDEGGISVIREGHFPSRFFEHLLDEWDVARSDVRPAAYPVVETHSEEKAAAIPPEELRLQIIAMLDGEN